MKTARPSLLRIFRELFVLSALVLGGGYVILVAAEERFARKLKWFKEGELLEMLPVFQMIPGIIGAHTAIYVGRRLAGIPGAIVAIIGVALPSVIIFLGISLAYAAIPSDGRFAAAMFTGLRAAIAGVMMSITVRSWRKSVNGLFGYTLLVLAFAALSVLRIVPFAVIAIAMLAGLCAEYYPCRRERVFRSFGAIPLIFFGYGLIAFGGGFVLIPAYIDSFVGESARYLQLAPDDFANIIALSQMTPGPIAVNCATFFGYRMGGVAGSLVASAALLLPGSVILYFALASIDRFRESRVVQGILRGVKPVTIAMLLAASWAFSGMSLWRIADGGVVVSPLAVALALAAFIAVHSKKLGAVATILAITAISVGVGALFCSGGESAFLRW